MKPSATVLKNATADEIVAAAVVAKEEDEETEDKVRAQMITAKEKRMWVALLEHLQTTVNLQISTKK